MWRLNAPLPSCVWSSTVTKQSKMRSGRADLNLPAACDIAQRVVRLGWQELWLGDREDVQARGSICMN